MRRWGFALRSARTFFCFAKRKYAKKATRRQRPASPGSQCYLESSRRCGTRPGTGLRQILALFRERLRCSALSTGRENRRTPKLLTLNNVWKSEPLGRSTTLFRAPVETAEQRRFGGKRARTV